MTYRKISQAFWEGDLAARLRGDADALAVAFYVMTCPAANAIGCYRLSLPTLVDDIGIPEGRALEALGKLSLSPSQGLPGFLVFDEAYRMVFVTEFARHEWGEVPNPKDNRTRGLLKMLDTFTDVSRKSFVWRAFADRYAEPWAEVLEGLAKPFPSPSEALAKGFSRARQDQDPEQDQRVREDSHPGARAPTKAERDFESWVGDYPNPVKRTGAKARWCKLKAADRDVDQVKAFLDVAVVSEKWTREDGRYIPGLEPFVNGKLWQDPLDAYPPARGNGNPHAAGNYDAADFPAIEDEPMPVEVYLIMKETLEELRKLPEKERDTDQADEDLDRRETYLRAALDGINSDPVLKAELRAAMGTA